MSAYVNAPNAKHQGRKIPSSLTTTTGRGQNGRALRLAARPDGHHALLCVAEGLGHTGGAGPDERATGNHSAGVVIQRGGIPLVRSADGGITTGDLDGTIGIDPVPIDGDPDRAPGNGDLPAGGSGHPAAEHPVPATGAATESPLRQARQ